MFLEVGLGFHIPFRGQWLRAVRRDGPCRILEGRQTFQPPSFPIPSTYLSAQMHHGNILSLVFLGRTTLHSLNCWLSTGGLLVAGQAGCIDHGHRAGASLISRLLTLEA